jgi:hypothetical protein
MNDRFEKHLSKDRDFKVPATFNNYLQRKGVNESICIDRYTVWDGKQEIVPGKKGLKIFGWQTSLFSTPDKVITSNGEKSLPFRDLVDNSGPEQKEETYTFDYQIAYIGQDYKDKSNRAGKKFAAKIYLPKSTAMELQKQIDVNPTIVREIIEKMVKEQILKEHSDAWEKPMTGTERGNKYISTPMRPPWEKMDQMDGSGGKFLIYNGDKDESKIIDVNEK